MTGGLSGTEISSNIGFGKVNCRLFLQIKLTLFGGHLLLLDWERQIHNNKRYQCDINSTPQTSFYAPQYFKKKVFLSQPLSFC